MGWGDKYDYLDAGENIDITNVPDGTYWLRAIADPYHYSAESNPSNNITDTMLTISGSTVTILQQTHPDSTPPTVTLTAPVTGATVSGNVVLSATATPAQAPVVSAQFLLDGQPLGPPQTMAPYSFTWNTAGTSVGQHILSAQVTDAKGFIGTAPPAIVFVPQAIGSFTVDRTVTQAGSGPVTTLPFSTSGSNELLLAFVSLDGPNSARSQTATVSGAGLAWSLVKRSNGQPGDAEIWSATASNVLSNVTVASAPSISGFDQLLTVVALQGASGTGAAVAGGGASGAPSVSFTSTAAGSLGFAVGHDYSSAIAPTLGSGQSLVSQWLDTRTGDTFWVQSTSVTTTSTGQTVTLNDTAPTGDIWNMAGVEVLPSGSLPPPPDTTPPTGNFINPDNGQTVSGSVPVTVNATDNVAVASVQLSLDGQPLGPVLTASPYAYTWDTTTASNGNHTLGATIKDTSGNVGTAPSITVNVQNPPPPMTCFIIDAKTFVDGSGTVTTPAFHTGQAGELLLAFVSSDGPKNANQTVTVSGAGPGL